MKRKLLLLLIVLNFSKIYAGDNFLSSLTNSNPNSKTELLIFYKNDCPYCLKMEQEINANFDFQSKLKNTYSIKLIDVETIAGKEQAQINNISSVPSIIKTDLISNKKTTLKGFTSVLKLESDLTSQISLSNKAAATICGNGIIESGETCDDGNTINGDGCANNCKLEGVDVCGNEIVEAGETCDDGNIVNGDGCASNCQVEFPPICGNGIVEAGETCDDGNTINGDGCPNNCQVSLGVDNFEVNNSHIRIIPNPAKNYIYIQSEINPTETFLYKIFDTTGRILQSENSKFNEKIGVENLVNGTYLVLITTKKGEKITRKLIKN